MDKPHLDKYLASGGDKCPWCDVAELRKMETWGNLHREVQCRLCRRSWTEEYRLTSAGLWTEEEEQTNEDEDQIDDDPRIQQLKHLHREGYFTPGEVPPGPEGNE